MNLHAAQTLRPRPEVPEVAWWFDPQRGERHGYAGDRLYPLCNGPMWTARMVRNGGASYCPGCMTVLRQLLAGAVPADEPELETRFAFGDR